MAALEHIRPTDVRTVAELLACTPDRLDRFAEVCAAATDWGALWRAAVRHGVDAILLHYVDLAGLDRPREIAPVVARREASLGLWRDHLHGVLADVLGVLDAAGVRSVALKGPVLGERLYPATGLRASSDLDFLVAEGDLDRAVAALVAAGCRYVPEGVNAYHRRHHHHVALTHESGVPVELHFRAHSGFGTIVASEPLIARARPYGAGSGQRLALSPEDELVFLAAHAARHYDVELLWLYDIKLLADRHPDLDWEVAASRARSWSLSRAVALVCEDAARHLGVAVPETVGRLSRPRARFVEWFRARRAEGAGDAPRMRLAALLYSAALCDGVALSVASLGRNTTRIARRRLSRRVSHEPGGAA